MSIEAEFHTPQPPSNIHHEEKQQIWKLSEPIIVGNSYNGGRVDILYHLFLFAHSHPRVIILTDYPRNAKKSPSA